MLDFIDKISRNTPLAEKFTLCLIISFTKKLKSAQRLMDVVKEDSIAFSAINAIQRCKDFFQEEYQDHSLLICQPDGTPLDPCYLVRGFRKCQQEMGIPEEERIDFQGLRKSGQIHKVRLTQNNYQLVADNAGQSPEVLMHNYNEASAQRQVYKYPVSILPRFFRLWLINYVQFWTNTCNAPQNQNDLLYCYRAYMSL